MSRRVKPEGESKSRPAVPSRLLLPPQFARWFETRGWAPREHQLARLAKAQAGRSTLLIAPTGAGKTLAGFLPSLVKLAETKKPRQGAGLHTLYISPLKALTTDIARNLEIPVGEMRLPIKTETRTGDTSAARRARQREKPPHILLTTPEQLALMLSHPDAPYLFADLDTLILDELHALAASKRGDLLALDVARLRTFAPQMLSIGLSATVARPSELRAYLQAQPSGHDRIALADLVVAKGGAKPKIEILELETPTPWSGHLARYAIPSIYEAIGRHKLSLVFVNTRMQAELVFRELWE